MSYYFSIGGDLKDILILIVNYLNTTNTQFKTLLINFKFCCKLKLFTELSYYFSW